jgi:sugar phosphate permease
MPLPQAFAVPKRRWGIALLLGFGVLVNYFDCVNLSVSRDALQASFGISAVMFGYLSSAYNWTYALLQLPSGLLLDRFGVRRIGIISTIIWSVASFAAAISTGVAGLFGARFLLGIGEAPTFPANAKATGYWFPKNERSLATAVFDSWQNLLRRLGYPCWASCWCISAGAGILRRRIHQPSISRCSMPSIEIVRGSIPDSGGARSSPEEERNQRIGRRPPKERRWATCFDNERFVAWLWASLRTTTLSICS